MERFGRSRAGSISFAASPFGGRDDNEHALPAASGLGHPVLARQRISPSRRL